MRSKLTDCQLSLPHSGTENRKTARVREDIPMLYIVEKMGFSMEWKREEVIGPSCKLLVMKAIRF